MCVTVRSNIEVLHSLPSFFFGFTCVLWMFFFFFHVELYTSCTIRRGVCNNTIKIKRSSERNRRRTETMFIIQLTFVFVDWWSHHHDEVRHYQNFHLNALAYIYRRATLYSATWYRWILEVAYIFMSIWDHSFQFVQLHFQIFIAIFEYIFALKTIWVEVTIE